MKTREQVEALKENWKADPVFDLENTAGFEEYRDELIAYSKKIDQENANKHKRNIEKKCTEIHLPCYEEIEYISTFREINNMLPRGDFTTDQALAHAQIQATLLLAAYAKYLAHSLKEIQGTFQELHK